MDIPQKINNSMDVGSKKNNLLLLSLCFLTFHNILAQSSSFSTTFGNDSIEIKYNVKGKKGIIKATHKIPMHSFPIEEISSGKKAKKPNDTLRISSLNYRLLDSLVWIECNKYRKEKNLKRVAWNDTIYKASVNHSEYQAYFNIIGHGETDSIPGKRESQKHYYRMRFFCAEICLRRSFNDGKLTYDELAKEIIVQWKNSPRHNAIMITPDYKLNSFSSALRYDFLSLLTRENLLRYNPELLSQIEKVIPDYFKNSGHDPTIDVWCTGNFMESENVKKKLELLDRSIIRKSEKGTDNKNHNDAKKTNRKKKVKMRLKWQ